MEYYDSINKQELHIFYLNKSTKLLQNEKVVELLDQNKNILDNSDDIQLFKTNPYQKVVKKSRRRSMSNNDLPVIRYQPTFTETSDRTGERKGSTDDKTKRQQDKMLIRMKTKQEFNNLDCQLNKITHDIDEEITSQTSKFEQMKKRKLEIQKSSNKIKLKSYLKSPSKQDDKTDYSSNAHSVNLEDNFKEIFRQKRDSVILSLMQREIEEFIERNMAEMHKEESELRFSFEEDIRNIDAEVYPDLVENMKEDMNIEIQNLRDQYEEQRSSEIEKIRMKHMKQK